MERKNTREEARSLLNSALETIIDEISNEPSLLSDSEECFPSKYIIHIIGQEQGLIANLIKIKTGKKYNSFQQYFNNAKKVITDLDAHLGRKALKAHEILYNFLNHSGFKLLKPETKGTVMLMEEILTRISRYNKNFPGKIRKVHEETIDSETIITDPREEAYDLFLNPRTMAQLKKYERRTYTKPLKIIQKWTR